MPFERLQKPTRGYQRQQQHVNMIAQHGPRAKFILADRYSPLDRPYHYHGDFRPKEILGTFPSGVEIAIHPNKGLAIGILSGRRKQRYGQASVQMPCNKESFARGTDVWQSAPGETHRGIVGLRDHNSQEACEYCRGKSVEMSLDAADTSVRATPARVYPLSITSGTPAE
jgi:hypothetical protein